ncbi:MAG: hypothetical protein WBF81_01595 [Thermoplasmata archaeon]
MARKTERWPGPEFHSQAVFRAPLPFVFSWCTDFDPGDARREREDYMRRVIARTSRRVVYEDLSDDGKGWSWSRHVVRLDPPAHWHSDSIGSHRSLSLDYVLTPLAADRTRLDLRWRRRPTAIGLQKVSKRKVESGTNAAWRNFARELEKDYGKSRGRT